MLLRHASHILTGELIDNQLLAIVQDRIKTGQTVDDYAMREILVDLLTAVGKETMLRENGGTRDCCVVVVRRCVACGSVSRH
jgi:hypothetical protein